MYHEHVIAKEPGGEVITPVIYSRLAWRYLGIQAHPEEGIAIAFGDTIATSQEKS